MKETEEVMQGN